MDICLWEGCQELLKLASEGNMAAFIYVLGNGYVSSSLCTLWENKSRNNKAGASVISFSGRHVCHCKAPPRQSGVSVN